MELGIYLDLRNPPRWSVSPARVYGFALELCEEAERRGAHSVWVSEHHMFEDGYLPQPLTFLAAAAARTRRVRLGTAALVAPLRSAPQLAEEAAIVDLISEGRLDLGLGAGYLPQEFELFGADITRRYGAVERHVEALREYWTSGPITPRPAGDSIPLWLAFNGPQGARRAGRLDTGLLSASPDLIEPYVAGLREGGHDPARARMTGPVPMFLSEDPERDWPLVNDHLDYQQNSYTEASGRPPFDVAKLRRHGLGSISGSFLLATPQDAAEAIRARFTGTPVQTIFPFVSIAGMAEDVVMRHLGLLLDVLAPAIADVSIERSNDQAPVVR